MQSFESYVLTYFVEIAPVVATMAIVIYFLWRDNRELVKYTRLRDKENLETLQDISNFLDTYIHEQRENNTETAKLIKDKAAEVKIHIDERTTSLKEILKTDEN